MDTQSVSVKSDSDGILKISVNFSLGYSLVNKIARVSLYDSRCKKKTPWYESRVGGLKHCSRFV